MSLYDFFTKELHTDAGLLSLSANDLGRQRERMREVNSAIVEQGAGWNTSTQGLRSLPTKLTAWLPLCLSLGAVLLCTWVSFHLSLNLASVGFLYLVFVVLAAVYGGFWQATAIAVVAVCCLDYFFDEPILSFTVGRFSNWVQLGAFEFTAMVISQLSNRVKLRALEAEAGRRNTARLYHTACRILLQEESGDPGDRVCSLIRDMFDLRAVALFDAFAGKHHYHGEGSEQDRESMRRDTENAYHRDRDSFDSDRRLCVLRLGARPVGAVGLCGTDVSDLIAGGVASLTAIALERARILDQQFQTEAARRAEQLRTSVLDALAHKFKTPLTVIRTATSGLPAAGKMSQLQTELVSLIDQEASKLNDLASRLLGAPVLDSAEFEPEPEPLLMSRMMKAAVQEIESQCDRERFRISMPDQEPPVLADRELVLTALAQLVDNALKYSIAGSQVEAALDFQNSAMILSVRSRGLVLEKDHQERIFERFYRAPGASNYAQGTGLGLSIVKTIAADHHGRVWAEGEPGYGTVFYFSLPVITNSES